MSKDFVSGVQMWCRMLGMKRKDINILAVGQFKTDYFMESESENLTFDTSADNHSTGSTSERISPYIS